jgi:hypothetical protein
MAGRCLIKSLLINMIGLKKEEQNSCRQRQLLINLSAHWISDIQSRRRCIIIARLHLTFIGGAG